MKLSKDSKTDDIIPPENWQCFDDCPVCRMMKRAAEKGREINSKEWERTFAEAEAEIDAV